MVLLNAFKDFLTFSLGTEIFIYIAVFSAISLAFIVIYKFLFAH